MSDPGRVPQPPGERQGSGAASNGSPFPLLAALDRIGGGFSFFLTILASTTIASTMFIITAEVIARAAFNVTLPGVAEFVAYAIVACVFGQLGSTIRSGRLISAEFLMAGWSERKPMLAHGAQLLFAVIAALLLWRATNWLWTDFVRSYQRNEYAGSIGAFQMTLWPFKLAVVIGAVTALLECVRLALLHGYRIVDGLRSTDAQRRAGLRGLVIFFALVAGFTAYMTMGDHNAITIGILAFIGLFVLVACGMPVAFALIAMSFLGIWLARDNIVVASNGLGIALSGAVRSFEFGVIPLFIMMGLLLERAGVGRDAFQVAVVILRHVRGGLGIATVAANAVFAAITGSSIASAAVFSRIAVQPMCDAGHTKRFAVGVIAGSSVLGMLIPPSLLLIVYGLLAEVSIGALFIAAIVPGIALAVVFALLNVVMATFFPNFVGRAKGGIEVESMSIMEMAVRLGPVVFLIVLVMGGIYGGIFSPTEAGATGAFGALLVTLARRKLTVDTIKDVVLQTGYIAAGILFLMMAANLYARMLTLSTIPMQATLFIGGLDLTLLGFMLIYLVLVILLGMILDSVSIMLIILPIAVPIVMLMGGDLIWFGIVTVIAIEIGLLTPPFGLSVFVVKSSLPNGFATLGEIFYGTAPFVVATALFTLLLIFVPGIALFLL